MFKYIGQMLVGVGVIIGTLPIFIDATFALTWTLAIVGVLVMATGTTIWVVSQRRNRPR